MVKLAQPGLPVVYLKAGELYFSRKPSVVVTVLGSCLSVTMHHPRTGAGGICHGLLPQCAVRKQCAAGCAESARYVDCAIRKMLGLFDRHEIKRGEIEVKFFGGADMFRRPAGRSGDESVGTLNVAAARKILEREGLKPNVADVGGQQGRKIIFYTHTGEVLLKRLRSARIRQAEGGKDPA